MYAWAKKLHDDAALLPKYELVDGMSGTAVMQGEPLMKMCDPIVPLPLEIHVKTNGKPLTKATIGAIQTAVKGTTLLPSVHVTPAPQPPDASQISIELAVLALKKNGFGVVGFSKTTGVGGITKIHVSFDWAPPKGVPHYDQLKVHEFEKALIEKVT